MWWRMYGYKTKPLPSKSDFRDKIFNGDFEPSCYRWQAYLCEHELAKYNEKGAVMKARRKRLYEDFEKDETYRLDYLFSEFSKNFDITKQQAEKEALKCSGELIDLYYIIEEKYPKYNIIRSKRGRPKKVI